MRPADARCCCGHRRVDRRRSRYGDRWRAWPRFGYSEPPRPFAYLSSPQRAALGVLRGGMARRPCRGDVIELRVARRPILFASIETPRPREPAGSARRGSGANFIGRVRPSPPAAHAEPGQLHAAPNLAPLGSAMSAPFAPGAGGVGDPPCCDKTPRREPGSPKPSVFGQRPSCRDASNALVRAYDIDFAIWLRTKKLANSPRS